MELPFTKMHGCGNDFIFIDCLQNDIPNLARLAGKLCDRRFGIGADQLLTVHPSRIADFKMEIYNADGSQVEMCGNGIRCFAKYVCGHGLTEKRELEVETLAGIIRPRLVGDLVEVDMGEPILEAEAIPTTLKCERIVDCAIEDWPEGKLLPDSLQSSGTKLLMTCVSMGNPHAVFYSKDVSKVPLGRVGPILERVQRAVAARSHRDLSPLLMEQVPGEVSPLLRSINELLERLEHGCADRGAGDHPPARCADAGFHPRSRAPHRLRVEGAARLGDAGGDLLAVERLGLAAALADGQRGVLGALVGREPLPAHQALPPSADRRPALGRARVHHPVAVGRTVRTAHADDSSADLFRVVGRAGRRRRLSTSRGGLVHHAAAAVHTHSTDLAAVLPTDLRLCGRTAGAAGRRCHRWVLPCNVASRALPASEPQDIVFDKRKHLWMLGERAKKILDGRPLVRQSALL